MRATSHLCRKFSSRHWRAPRRASRVQFGAMMASALGGWVAERLIFGDVSTGASNDIEKATGIARSMVTTYGMSDSLGPQTLGQRESAGFLHAQAGGQSEGRNYSEK